ncbi:MAG: CoA transferase [Acidimicrobiia bacterium]
MSQTLEGLRILDLTRMLAGPYGTLLLGDMGAEIIKIEDPSGGDPIRTMGPPFVDGESAYFLGINRNKRSVAIDLQRSEGRDLFLELVRVSDVVIDNFRVGVMQRLGIDHGACAQVKSDIITCSITGFGEDGPYRDLPAFDLILQAMGGAMSITGERDGSPVRMGIPMGDLAGGMLGALAILGAIVQRDRTGRGQHIDLSLLDAQVSLLTYVAQYWLTDGQVPGPIGTEHQSVVPYQLVETSTSPIVIAVFVDRHWAPFCEVLGCHELIDQYPTNAQRHAARDVIVPLLRARFLEREAEEWIDALRTAGVPCGPVNTVDRVLTDDQVRHRGMVTETSSAHPRVGVYPVVGNPIKVGDAETFEPAPLLGQDNDEILGGLLEHSAQELAAWRAAGVVAEGPAVEE